MEEMVQKDFLPSLFSYVNDLACTGSTKKELVPGITTKAEEKLITKLSGLADTISDELDILKDMIGTTEGMDDYLKAGTYTMTRSLPRWKRSVWLSTMRKS